MLSSEGELLHSGPPARATGSGWTASRLGLAAGLVAAAGVAALVARPADREVSPPVAFVESWIDAWNARDAQAVSAMTCPFVPAFVPAGIVEEHLDEVPAGQPVVSDHRITGTEPGTAYGREAVRVRVTYLPAARDTTRERSIFVRVTDDEEACIGSFVPW